MNKDNIEKETFKFEKSNETIIEILFNIVLSFYTMAKRMDFTGSMMYSYFSKCLTDNVLLIWCLVIPNKENQRFENFK